MKVVVVGTPVIMPNDGAQGWPDTVLYQMHVNALFVPENEPEASAVGSRSLKGQFTAQFAGTETAAEITRVVSRAARDIVLAWWGLSLKANDIVLPQVTRGQY